MIVALENQVTSMSNQLNRYGTVEVAQYPHSASTSNGDLTPYAGGTWLDLMHPDNPANNRVYPLVVDWCVQERRDPVSGLGDAARMVHPPPGPGCAQLERPEVRHRLRPQEVELDERAPVDALGRPVVGAALAPADAVAPDPHGEPDRRRSGWHRGQDARWPHVG
jgi:hypothetical protein